MDRWPSRTTSYTRRWAPELSWPERALPERVRTKHVHRLHPYHGTFIPQLADVLLESGLDATGVEHAEVLRVILSEGVFEGS